MTRKAGKITEKGNETYENEFPDVETSYLIKAKAFTRIFRFRKTSWDEVEKIISNLNIKKACQQEEIPIKIIKLNKDLIPKFIAGNFNSCIDEGEFPSELKHAEKRKEKKRKTRVTKVIADQ